MSKLIDADKLKRKCQKVATEAWKMKIKASIETTLNQFIDWIDQAEPVDAVPVRHGRWKHKKDLKQFFCDQCGEPSLTEDDVYFYGMEFPNFCPNCGADMRKDGDHEAD